MYKLIENNYLHNLVIVSQFGNFIGSVNWKDILYDVGIIIQIWNKSNLVCCFLVNIQLGVLPCIHKSGCKWWNRQYLAFCL